MEIQSFFKVSWNFRAIFFDSYGVLKNHMGLIDGVDDTIADLKADGIPIRILTNDASRTPEQQFENFRRKGLTHIAVEEIITSGMMAQQFLIQKIMSGNVAYLGTPNSAEYIRQAGLRAIPVSDLTPDIYDTISAFVFLDDEGFDWSRDLNRTINFVLNRNVPVIVANSDKLYPVSKNTVAVAAGGIAQIVENLTGKKFLHFGKPDTQMYIYAFEDLSKLGNFQKRDVLMVGDNLSTDILGANKFGIQTALVLTGNTSPKNFQVQIATTGIIPDFVCKSITE